jgi:hypothetical protein
MGEFRPFGHLGQGCLFVDGDTFEAFRRQYANPGVKANRDADILFISVIWCDGAEPAIISHVQIGAHNRSRTQARPMLFFGNEDGSKIARDEFHRCESASLLDPAYTNRINDLARRSASGPHAD